MTTRKSVLLRLDADDLRRVDRAVRMMARTRSGFLREAIRRNLRYFDEHQRPILEGLISEDPFDRVD